MHVLDGALHLGKTYFNNGERISEREVSIKASVAALNCDLDTHIVWNQTLQTLYISVVPEVDGLPERDRLEALFEALNKSSNPDYWGFFSPIFAPSALVFPKYEAQTHPPWLGTYTGEELWDFMEDSVVRGGMGALAFESAKQLKYRYPSPAVIDLLFREPGKYLQ